MTGAGTAGIAAAPAAAPELRITAHVFEWVHRAPCTALRRAHGGLTLLQGPEAALTVALPWGTVVAAGPGEDGTVALHSMNRHADAFTADREGLAAALAAGAVPSWAVPAVKVLLARTGPTSGVRMVVNQELPARMGLLTGAETAHAAALTLADLYGRAETAPRGPERDPSYAASLHAREGHAMLVANGAVRHVPCDLASAGLRLMIIDVGPDGEDGARPAASTVPADLVERAGEALRAGDPGGLGPLLTEGHVPGGPLLDGALDAARSAGALGGLAVGRCGLALVPMAAVADVRARVAERTAGRARRRPRFLTVVPSGA
ncbi:hypothetical protein ACIBF1_10830 [Spirillospora sp. NPDC050679]